MSKRFGRNQKRKLQEEAQRYKEALDMSNGLNNFLAKRHKKDLDVLRKVECVLGDNNFLLEPKTIALSQKTSTVKIASIEKDKLVRFAPDEMVADTTLHSQVLHLLEVSEKIDQIRNCTHLEVRWGDQRAGYAISNEAMMNMPPSFLVEQVTVEIAKLLVQEINQV